MRNKKGDMTLEEGSGLILGLVAMVILGFLAFGLFSMVIGQDMKNAKSFIDSLDSKIENLNDGESNTFILQGLDGWVLVGYELSNPLRPEKCFLNSCLCLCEGEPKDCQDKGYCRPVDRKISVMSKGHAVYNIVGTPVMTDKSFSVQCMIMDNQFSSIEISKTTDLVSINFDYGVIDYNPDLKFRICPGYELTVAS